MTAKLSTVLAERPYIEAAQSPAAVKHIILILLHTPNTSTLPDCNRSISRIGKATPEQRLGYLATNLLTLAPSYQATPKLKLGAAWVWQLITIRRVCIVDQHRHLNTLVHSIPIAYLKSSRCICRTAITPSTTLGP